MTLMTKDEKKKLMGSVVEHLVKLVFNTQFYEWDGKIYRQKYGGPIGLRSTGIVCTMQSIDVLLEDRAGNSS